MAYVSNAMTAAMKLLPSVTTAPTQAAPYAGMVANAFRLHIFAMEVLTVLMAPTSLILGRIVLIAKQMIACPAQVFLATVQSFATEMQLVQMLGMNY